MNAYKTTQTLPQTTASPSNWVEWMSLMGYAGIVALAVSGALFAAVVLVGSA
jgi:hypothetical protein